MNFQDDIINITLLQFLRYKMSIEITIFTMNVDYLSDIIEIK